MNEREFYAWVDQAAAVTRFRKAISKYATGVRETNQENLLNLLESLWWYRGIPNPKKRELTQATLEYNRLVNLIWPRIQGKEQI